MRSKPWFDRTFCSGLEPAQYEPLYSRLENAPQQFAQTVSPVAEEILSIKPGQKWSVRENIGHLLLLEDLWLQRFKDISENKKEMTPTDLGNSATDEANFNQVELQHLLSLFAEKRKLTLKFLQGLSDADLRKTSLHPRLHKPFSIIDLMYFVAEHDEHHLTAIRHIIQQYAQR